MFFIGDVRRFLFISGSWKWNAVVRDVTALLESTRIIRSNK